VAEGCSECLLAERWVLFSIAAIPAVFLMHSIVVVCGQRLGARRQQLRSSLQCPPVVCLTPGMLVLLPGGGLQCAEGAA
jgi:hypothetical protein